MDQTSRDTFVRVEVKSDAELWSWLERNHTQSQSVWLVTWKRQIPERYVSRESVLDALIAFGWVDGRRMKLDDERTMQLIAPRKQQVWAQTYKARAARLIKEGRMQPAGLSAVEAAKVSGKWDTLAHVDALEEPDALIRALDGAGAISWWRASAKSYRRNVLRWIATAKTDKTRQKRIRIIDDHAARGQKVPHY